MKRNAVDPRGLAVTAVMTAIVFVLTRVIQVPTPAKGYIHLGDAGVFFASFAFGPWVGAVAGGLGTALADFTSPYAQWAIPSLLIHGAQGLIVGWATERWSNLWGLILSSVVGGAIVVGGYLLAGMLLSGTGAALGELPMNIVQVAVGAIVAIPLFNAVRKSYPPISRPGQQED